jgi:hypothetical protein
MIRTKWTLTKSWGTRLLGIWLVASALVQLLNIRFIESSTLLALLAGAAGVFLLLDR